MEKQQFGPDGTRLLLDIVDVTLENTGVTVLESNAI